MGYNRLQQAAMNKERKQSLRDGLEYRKGGDGLSRRIKWWVKGVE